MTEADSINTIIEALKPHDNATRKNILQFSSSWVNNEFIKDRDSKLREIDKANALNPPPKKSP